ncbi:hypothetical protein CLOBOL_06145 [Enterocloster bolteae ATCC BAA-613]|uniref:Uncharacterized protein n=1 Tax=Enterocloster bolteae (strain ATCC BAA-613 / DSM 15670 / CCUG 46953 / JCM 12243 / WAL 16351) TaxID=411902 RepID=A8S1R9_ENTBW|nr:hypothetical protein CLOBOL_06145 [Enterocloster bolteae ATCC BAA-613]
MKEGYRAEIFEIVLTKNSRRQCGPGIFLRLFAGAE